MTLKAVIFGSIGSFSETSRIQLESFNEALSQNGLKHQWDEKEYIEFLKIQGGLNRLKQVFPESSSSRVDCTGAGSNDQDRLLYTGYYIPELLNL